MLSSSQYRVGKWYVNQFKSECVGDIFKEVYVRLRLSWSTRDVTHAVLAPHLTAVRDLDLEP